jgi:hypothetical protein
VVSARRALHAVAELLLAGPQWRATGEIALTVTAGGFRTGWPPAEGIEVLEVSGPRVLARPGDRSVPLAGPLWTIAAALGVTPGGPSGLYGHGADLGPDDDLTVDPDAVAVVLGSLTAGAAALEQLAADTAEVPILWPEHFDVGIALDEINYGVSPGDAEHPLPYAYVGPWTKRAGDFWNEPFGASRPVAELDGVAGILAFFHEGRARAA